MKADHALDAWSIRVDDVSDDPADIIRHAVAVAMLAPSGHNTQPWRFVLHDHSVEVWADRSRRLPVVDPDDRELLMSCGAALDHLVLVLEHLGLPPGVEILPDGGPDGPVARVTVPTVGAERGARLDEVSAITRRHTYRMRFDSGPVDEQLLDRMRPAAEALGAWVHVVPAGQDRAVLAGLIAEGDRVQMSNPAFRRELAAWVRPNHSPARDGIRARALGIPGIVSRAAPWMLRTFDMGRRQAAKDRRLVVEAPLVVVLGTDGDEVTQWIAAGRALSRVALIATSGGASVAFLNQPVEIPALRHQLAELIGATSPQLLLRLGHGTQITAQPRRELDDVLVAS